jgi:5-methylcytosine-specific restriction endonuclease McrA
MIKDSKKWSINEVLYRVDINQKCDKPVRIKFDEDFVKINSQRLQNFKLNGIKCCACGISGKYFRKDKFLGSGYYHFNLYALGPHGNEILMTKDHTIPKSKGGKNVLNNYQTMCTKCNLKKGNNMM